MTIYSRISEHYTSAIDAYIQHIITPLQEIDADCFERALLYAISLFQYFEGLSPEGSKMTKTYVDKLYDAFFDHQVMRFPNASSKERTRRQTQILMIIAKVPAS